MQTVRFLSLTLQAGRKFLFLHLKKSRKPSSVVLCFVNLGAQICSLLTWKTTFLMRYH